MSKKVLVLCQRRSSIIQDLTPVTDSINTLVSSLIGEDVEIKYVSNLVTEEQLVDKDGVDLIGEFGDNDFTRGNFTENDYSLIICNTCPYAHMDYSVIYKYLKAEGTLALTGFSLEDNIDLGIYAAGNGYKSFITQMYTYSLGRNSGISKWFVPVEYPHIVVSLFEKRPLSSSSSLPAPAEENESSVGGKNRKMKPNIHNTHKRRKTKKVRKSKKLRRRRYKNKCI